MKIKEYRKAIASLLTAVAAFITAILANNEFGFSPQALAILGGVAGAAGFIATFLVRNGDKPEKA